MNDVSPWLLVFWLVIGAWITLSLAFVFALARAVREDKEQHG